MEPQWYSTTLPGGTGEWYSYATLPVCLGHIPRTPTPEVIHCDPPPPRNAYFGGKAWSTNLKRALR